MISNFATELSEDAGRLAPTLAGADWSQIERVGRQMRQIWADFARGGNADDMWSTDVVRFVP